MKRLAMLAPVALLAACERQPEPPSSVETEIPNAPAASIERAPSPPPAEPVEQARPEIGASDGRPAIPSAFRGDWAATAAACGTRDDRNLTLTADRLRFWESEGVVTAIEVDGARLATVNARYTGEGESWSASSRMVLSPDGERLTITRQGSATVRVRC